MITITAAQLRHLCAGLDGPRAELYASVLGEACTKGEINTPKRLCNFLESFRG